MSVTSLKYKHFVSLVLIVMFSCLSNMNVVATEQQQNELPFNFQTVAPANQRTQGNYFDLDVSAGEKQEVTVNLNNLSETDLIIKPTLLRAVTTKDGKISYGMHQDELIESPSVDITQVIELPEAVTIPKNGSQELHVTINVPKSFNQGTILAGVELASKEKHSATTNQIDNTYAYMFSIALHHKKAVDPLVKIEDSQLNFIGNQTYIETPIINPEVGIQRDLKITTQLIDTNTDSEIESKTKKELKMAPESTMNYEVGINKLSPGTYSVQTVVEFSNQRTIKHETQLTVDENVEGPQTISEELPKSTTNNHALYKWLTTIIVVLIVTAIAIKIYQDRQK
ncbi:WxL protein peptidoglycan domain-containing protein [Vagococcus zengguangii]|nr:DUF916 domain-containing protein [Vagococcus zengguangii]